MSRLAAALLLGLLLLAAGAASAQPDALYARHCVTCHGSEGRGDGPAAGLLSPRPRDFTAGVYKFRSTPTGTLPTVEDLARTIRVGLPGTSMPGFEGLISAEDVEALARRLLEWAPRTVPTAPSMAMGLSPAHSLVHVQRGRELYAALGCAGCHGGNGQAAEWRPEREGPGLPSPPADLTQPWSFRGGGERAAIALRLVTGLDGSPMPSYGRVLSRDQAFQIAMFVQSLARRPIWEELDPDRVRRAGVATDPLARGRYLTNAMQCSLCHTPISPDTGAYLTERFMAGGMRVSVYPWGVWYGRNLTPDRDTGLGRWSEAEIVRALTEGVARDGRHLDPMAMPWPWFSRLTRADARAIAVYLKSLPPIANAVPASEWGWPGEMVGGKILAFFGVPAAVELWGGNAATDPALRGRIPAWWLHRLVSHLLGWAWLGGVGWLGWQAWLRWTGAPARSYRARGVGRHGAPPLVAHRRLAATGPHGLDDHHGLALHGPAGAAARAARLGSRLCGARRISLHGGAVRALPYAGARLQRLRDEALAGGRNGRALARLWQRDLHESHAAPGPRHRPPLGCRADAGPARGDRRQRPPHALAGHALGHRLALVRGGPAGDDLLLPQARARPEQGAGAAPAEAVGPRRRHLLLWGRARALIPPQTLVDRTGLV